ncbi:hypothetical protein VTH06DRAFT_1584 [Thermothelomyces fergusii]
MIDWSGGLVGSLWVVVVVVVVLYQATACCCYQVLTAALRFLVHPNRLWCCACGVVGNLSVSEVVGEERGSGVREASLCDVHTCESLDFAG